MHSLHAWAKLVHGAYWGASWWWATQRAFPLLQDADDTFMEGSIEVAWNLSKLFDLFAYFSCLQLNRGRSVFMGPGLSPQEEIHFSEALGILFGTLPMWNLGLPLPRARLSTMDWQPVIEKVERHWSGGRPKCCQRSHLVFLHSVLYAIPSFTYPFLGYLWVLVSSWRAWWGGFSWEEHRWGKVGVQRWMVYTEGWGWCIHGVRIWRSWH